MAPEPIPDAYRAATPYLIVHDAAAALAFYKNAFGAAEIVRLADPSGKVMHAEIRIGGAPIMLADYFAISEEKLAALPADVVMELHTSGALRQIYAHLDSMQNWERLVARSMIAVPVAANA